MRVGLAVSVLDSFLNSHYIGSICQGVELRPILVSSRTPPFCGLGVRASSTVLVLESPLNLHENDTVCIGVELRPSLVSGTPPFWVRACTLA